ncbi:chemotaxis protein CheW [Desulfogranum marinum]|jgi:purine-binding chemotaxis protein CheW|uniref:chemotaxis protein CheW n=1 Tax=Desulfogranum marinum TaxID=453220 RepID=UPI0019644A45|nr:chemotaxis protein CheW [Desulfogranum marinum]MBM9511638.1 purine-binding chemotaxis protein CheW [Desulfogranum marinum]
MKPSSQSNKTMIELATFHVGDALCGMDILKVQEINKIMEMTIVPQSPDYVQGILNLRGQIVTIIDLGKKLGLGQTDLGSDPRNIIVNAPGEYVGLLVNKLSDVVAAEPDKIEPAPANMSGIQGSFFTGVYKTENKLIGVLDIKEVLRMDTENINRV